MKQQYNIVVIKSDGGEAKMQTPTGRIARYVEARAHKVAAQYVRDGIFTNYRLERAL